MNTDFTNNIVPIKMPISAAEKMKHFESIMNNFPVNPNNLANSQPNFPWHEHTRSLLMVCLNSISHD